MALASVRLSGDRDDGTVHLPQGESAVTNKFKYLAASVFVLLLTAASVAQTSYPKFEVPVDFSFINVHPDLPVITSFNVFGGGVGGVYNFASFVGIKADFQFYTQGTGVRKTLEHNGFPAGQLSANLSTYMFGPQIKKHSGKLHPFAEALFGTAHSNEFAQILEDEGITNKSSSDSAFAMEFGGGLDYAIIPYVELRPVEVDYLQTRFGVNGTTESQNNFKYSAGINIQFGGK
jgi:Outer membrane protein beta-barrel domain